MDTRGLDDGHQGAGAHGGNADLRADLTSATGGGRGTSHGDTSHYEEVPTPLQTTIIAASKAERGGGGEEEE